MPSPTARVVSSPRRLVVAVLIGAGNVFHIGSERDQHWSVPVTAQADKAAEHADADGPPSGDGAGGSVTPGRIRASQGEERA